MNTPSDLQTKLKTLGQYLQSFQKVIIAYSGGVDSVFLLKAAVEFLGADRVLACLGISPSLPQSEYQSACVIAQQIGVQLKIIHTHEINNPQYQANNPDRCYHCRLELYQQLNDLAQQLGYDAVCCGTNLDDLGDYRPGLQAAKKFNIRSPLEHAQLTKDDIRQLSKQWHLNTWNKPAQPCLASRMAYGLQITPDKLKQIENAEHFLHQLGFDQLRVRHHGPLARIEVPAEQIPKITADPTRQKITSHLKSLGFNYITLDLQGFRSGSGNEVL